MLEKHAVRIDEQKLRVRLFVVSSTLLVRSLALTYHSKLACNTMDVHDMTLSWRRLACAWLVKTRPIRGTDSEEQFRHRSMRRGQSWTGIHCCLLISIILALLSLHQPVVAIAAAVCQRSCICFALPSRLACLLVLCLSGTWLSVSHWSALRLSKTSSWTSLTAPRPAAAATTKSDVCHHSVPCPWQDCAGQSDLCILSCLVWLVVEVCRVQCMLFGGLFVNHVMLCDIIYVKENSSSSFYHFSQHNISTWLIWK